MSIKSHTVFYSLNRNMTQPGFLMAQNDAVIGFSFADPMGRLTFFTFDARLKEMEKITFKSIEEIEGALMTFLETRTNEAAREPIGVA